MPQQPAPRTDSDAVVIRRPKRGKAHLPIWGEFSVGMPWASRRPIGTECGHGDGPTVGAMSEHVDLDLVAPSERCSRCFARAASGGVRG